MFNWFIYEYPGNQPRTAWHCGRVCLARVFAPAHTRARAKAVYAAGCMAHHQGDYAAAHSLVEQGLTLFRELEDKAGVGDSLMNLGMVASAEGGYAATQALNEQSLALYRELGNKPGIANSLSSLEA